MSYAVDDFIEELSNIEMSWSIDNGYLRGKKDGKCFCPLTAIYFLRTGEYLPVSYAYRLLETDEEDAGATIIAQADNMYKDLGIRDKLLKATKVIL